jgi:lipopolysaccharide export system permease protein
VNILQRYILRELSVPVLLSIVFFTFILLIGQLFRFAEMLLVARAGWTIVLELVGVLAVSLLTLIVPMAALLGTIMGIGRMTAENEVLAIRVGGVPLWRVFWPVFAIAALATGVLLWASLSLVPGMIRHLSDRQTELQFRILTNLEPGKNYDDLAPRGSEVFLFFNERGERLPTDGEYTLRMKEVAMRVIGDVGQLTGSPKDSKKEAQAEEPQTLEMEAPRETVFFAREGLIEGNIAERSVRLTLFDGTLMPINRLVLNRETEEVLRREDRERETQISFGSITQKLSPRQDRRDIGRMDPRAAELSQLLQLTAAEPQVPMYERGTRLRLADEWETYLRARNELYNRISLPFSLLAFMLLAIPLAVEFRPTARTISFLLASAVILVYYLLISVAGALGMVNSSFTLPMYILPNVLIGGLGLFLFRRN